MLLDTGVDEPLPWSSPDTPAAVAVRQSEAGFVCEEYHAPLLSIPPLMVAAERPAGTAMTWCQGQTDDRLSGVEVESTQTAGHSPAAHSGVSSCPEVADQRPARDGAVSESEQLEVPFVLPAGAFRAS